MQKIADGGKDFEVTVNFDRVGVKKMLLHLQTGEMLDRVCRIVTVHVCENSNAVIKTFSPDPIKNNSKIGEMMV